MKMSGGVSSLGDSLSKKELSSKDFACTSRTCCRHLGAGHTSHDESCSFAALASYKPVVYHLNGQLLLHLCRARTASTSTCYTGGQRLPLLKTIPIVVGSRYAARTSHKAYFAFGRDLTYITAAGNLCDHRTSAFRSGNRTAVGCSARGAACLASS